MTRNLPYVQINKKDGKPFIINVFFRSSDVMSLSILQKMEVSMAEKPNNVTFRYVCPENLRDLYVNGLYGDKY